MEAKLFDKSEHCDLLAAWWSVHTGYDFNVKLFAEHGIIVTDEQDKPLALCFLYFPSNSKLCQLAFVTRNPSISPIIAGRALKLLVSFSLYASRALGYSMLYTATNNPTVQKLFKSGGLVAATQVSTEFIKEL